MTKKLGNDVFVIDTNKLIRERANGGLRVCYVVESSK